MRTTRRPRGSAPTVDAEADWAGCWKAYLEGYARFCGVGEDATEAVHAHLDSEFADAALWFREAPGCREGLAALAATGIRLGIVSNADGLIGERLRTRELLQVGPGLGVEVECVIDSGAVGVMKPDPRIFVLALDVLQIDPADAWYVGDMPGIDVVGARRAGLRPFLVDPLGLHHDADYDRVGVAHRARATRAGRLTTGLPPPRRRHGRHRDRQPARDPKPVATRAKARSSNCSRSGPCSSAIHASRVTRRVAVATAVRSRSSSGVAVEPTARPRRSSSSTTAASQPCCCSAL